MADSAAERLVGKAVLALKRHPSAHGYPDAWCDVVDQMQWGLSDMWDAYEGFVRATLLGALANLTLEQIESLWHHTDEGWDYEYDRKCLEEHGQCPDGATTLAKPCIENQLSHIVDMLEKLVLGAAADTELDEEVERGYRRRARRARKGTPHLNGGA